MKLMISQNIDNNRVRLDFRKSPDRPKNIPSYEIDSHNADEFVKEYPQLTGNKDLQVPDYGESGAYKFGYSPKEEST